MSQYEEYNSPNKKSCRRGTGGEGSTLVGDTYLHERQSRP